MLRSALAGDLEQKPADVDDEGREDGERREVARSHATGAGGEENDHDRADQAGHGQRTVLRTPGADDAEDDEGEEKTGRNVAVHSIFLSVCCCETSVLLRRFLSEHEHSQKDDHSETRHEAGKGNRGGEGESSRNVHAESKRLVVPIRQWDTEQRNHAGDERAKAPEHRCIVEVETTIGLEIQRADSHHEDGAEGDRCNICNAEIEHSGDPLMCFCKFPNGGADATILLCLSSWKS